MQYLLRKENTTGLAQIKSKYDYLLDYLDDFVSCFLNIFYYLTNKPKRSSKIKDLKNTAQNQQDSHVENYIWI